ncbi:hypothetical protein P154DRAFT_502660 [Amniculicola lignicola CBS 123094]|uniref:Chromo domain-containing protein n=1 Tax=Amniculicola lignicola CBS 123094 TaxID=1392246 RepID=A0A6A5VZ04_9PLEO|nr:hypothetical protein P154DRAFT_502660 [Amniculicola lignicola CBS 123094]
MDDEEDDEEEGSEEGEEYVVEKIISHRFDAASQGEIKYEVKWLGYEKKSDRTWEGEDNLENAKELLEQYWGDIGGKPEAKEGGSKKRKGRKSGVDSGSATPTVPAKKLKKEPEWAPPPGSWENDVAVVDTVEEQVNPKTGKLERLAYLVWNNDKKTQHPLHHVYKKCPQKMLSYYESHLYVLLPLNKDEMLTFHQRIYSPGRPRRTQRR